MQSYIISIQIPNYVIDILKIIESHHFEAYIVGGCVRDSLLSLQPKDWDITSNAEPTQIQKIFNLYKSDFEVIPIGLKYGTLGVKDKKTKNLVEITTYRTDGLYKDGRRPETIQFAKTLQEDLSRRDFTINAIACRMLPNDIDIQKYINPTLPSQCNLKYIVNLYTKNTSNLRQNIDLTQTTCFMQLFDYHNGIKHLQEKKIVCVGNAKERFLEDSLRIIRSIRFSSVLPFEFQLNHEAKEAAFLLTQRLLYISRERILAEFIKLLCGQYAHRILFTYQSIILFIFPPLKILNTTQLNHNYEALKIAPKNVILRLVLLFCPLPYAKDIYISEEKLQKYLYDYKAICKQLHFDNKTIQISQDLLQLLCNTDLKKINKIGLKFLLLQYDTKIISQLILLYIILQKTHEKILNKHKNSILLKTSTYSIKNLCSLTINLNDIIIKKECYKLSQLNINGNILKDIAKSMGISLKGKQIGLLLTTLLHAVINENIINDSSELENKARFYIEKLL